ncbi:NADH-ubiquinone oxidoreductase, chain 4L [Candidatus Thiomargarita nelsonii]|uniref:NADH-ubiquinone oxidoreductase, chain 4L n=1 Tax=Candidatus Thiomargarita nelsonii TaxID=1003181 RepID=A0A176S6H0_9GAMM|nr:NADH-ubiquinone oxidoreductase, chain 4L [Candidatus Thiomargarita nelsonii]
MTIEETAWIYIFSYCGAIGLILLGIFAMVMYRHLIRIIFGLILLEAGVNLFLITVGYRPNAVAPILVEGQVPAMVDPIPQALVLTAIVIGVGVQALALALVVKTYKAYGTLDTKVLAEKIAQESGTHIIDGIPVSKQMVEETSA